MKYIILINTYFMFHSLSYSQIVGFEKKDTTLPYINFNSLPNKKIIFGFNYEFIYYGYKDPVTFKRSRAMVNSFEPHFGYYFKKNKNLGFGLNGKIEYYSSNFTANNTPNVYEFGFFVRYFLPLSLNIKVFNRLSFSVDVSFNKTNYSRRDNDIYYFGTDSSYIMYNKLEQNLIRIGTAWQFRIYKGLNFKMLYRYEMFLNQFYKFRPAVGLEYHFYYEENKKVFRKE